MCHQEFPTPIGISLDSMRGFIISGLVHRCPRCQLESEYVTQDYHFPETVAEEPIDQGAALPVDMVASKATYEKSQADRYVPVLDVADVAVPTSRSDDTPVSPGT